MTMVKVLYQRTPMWRVGEDRPPSTSADLAARLEEFSALSAAERYPNDYCGRVISVLPADREFSPADLADTRRGVALMDCEDAAALRSRRLKIVRKASADVTFDDRWGAVSVELAKTWDDPELEEKFAAAEVAEAEDENKTRDADHERALAEWRETVAECLALGTVIDMPAPRHAGHVVVPENRFDVEVARVAATLPQTVTHTGAGLYKVQAAGTMATPAHLWAMDAVDPPDIGTPGGNPGTGSNVTVVGGQIGSALDFDGNDSNVNIGDVAELNLVQKLTMAFRMNQDALDQNAVLFRKQGASSSYRVTLQPAVDGQFYFIIANGANTFGRFDYSTRIDAGEWHHVAVVFDGSLVGDANRLKVYVDGIPVTLIFSGPIPATTADLSGVDATISWGAAPNAFNGKIDDFRIYANEAFTDAQVKDLAGRGLAHWDTIAGFDENKALFSEDYANAGWTKRGTCVAITNTTDTVDPNGANHAGKITGVDAGVNTHDMFQFVSFSGAGIPIYPSLWIKRITTSGILRVSNPSGTGFGEWRIDCSLLPDAWLRITDDSHAAVTEPNAWTSSGASQGGLHFQHFSGATALAFYLYGTGLNESGSTTYKPTRSATDTSVTLTTGGLMDGDRDGEVLVSSGNGYAVIRNGVDSVLVIGDATGESGACSISPYSQIQSALDQLWADQGAAAFTASQYIRIFAGTYDENVTINAGIRSAANYGFIIEGDPADDRANIAIAPSAGANTLVYNPSVANSNWTVRHLTFNGTPSTSHVQYYANTAIGLIKDCAFSVANVAVWVYQGSSIEDCEFVATGDSGSNFFIFPRFGRVDVKNCTFKGIDKTTWYGIFAYHSGSVIEGCTFSTLFLGHSLADGGRAANNTFYNCATGIRGFRGARMSLLNNVFSTCDTNIEFSLGWPQITATDVGPPLTLRNNVFYNYTNFAYDGSTNKTYAEIVAMNRVDAFGNLDATDPLLTDPGAGDFSLQAASPCRGTGHGSGVVAYVDGTAADASHPNIGAEGLATDPPAPVWTAGLSGLTATDERVGDEIALAWDAASIGGAGLSIEYGVQQRIGAGAWTTVWIGSGTSTHVCECTTDQLYQFRVGARCADYEQAWVYPTDSATATATLPVPPTVSDWTVSGTTVTVTLIGVAGRTYRARLMDGAGGEDDEQGRTGSGDVALTAAGYGARYFIAWEVSNGCMSEPTGVYAVTIDDPADADVAYYRVRTVMALPGAPHKTAILERIERPIQP